MLQTLLFIVSQAKKSRKKARVGPTQKLYVIMEKLGEGEEKDNNTQSVNCEKNITRKIQAKEKNEEFSR